MHRKLLTWALVGMALLTACAGTAAGAGVDPPPIPTPTQGIPDELLTDEPVSPDDPVSSDDPVQPGPGGADWQAPQPGDEAFVRSDAEVETADVLTLESFPPQFMLHLTGWKGTPCDQLRVTVAPPDSSHQIRVEVYTLVDPAGICIMMLEGFDINVPLGSHAVGEYTVLVNGAAVGTISAP